MENKEEVSFQIPKQLINPLIEEKIKLALLESIGDKDKLMSELVAFVLKQKVDIRGQKTGNSYSDKFSLIDVMLRQHTVEAVKEVISEILAEKRGIIKDELKRQLTSKKGSEKFVASLLDATERAMSSSWKLNVTAQFDDIQIS